MMAKGTILIVDDEAEIRSLLCRLLELENYITYSASSIDGAIEILNEEEINAVILDVRLGTLNSIDFIPQLKEKSPHTEIIILTAFGSIPDVVNSIKLGAFDYIVKGDDDDKVLPVVEKAIQKNLLSTKLHKLEAKIKTKYSFKNIIGKSLKLLEAVSLARKLTGSDTTVLLVGETGTGKEIFAQAIHYDGSRAPRPFVAVNCSSIPKDLLESELFGYKKGAFTGAVNNKKGLFEEADGGTLFLDEIGEMQFDLQAKLLRVLENNSFIKPGDSKETQVDVRIIAATNKNLEEAINQNAFRKDLFYRITPFIINLPSLRERIDDIPLLANFFINVFATQYNKHISSFDSNFFSILSKHSFPGNIRELKNVCERLVILSENGRINSANLPQEFFYSPVKIDESNDLSIAAMEKMQIKKVLSIAKHNKNRAAEILGIGLTTLYRKIEQYNLED